MDNTFNRLIRILAAKVGLDGHDGGARIIATTLRDAGMEVIYTGLRQTAGMVVNTALQEDVDDIGISILSGAHMTVFPKIINLIKEKSMDDVLITGGGIIPQNDMAELKEIGVGELFPPGTHTQDIVKYITGWVHTHCMRLKNKFFAILCFCVQAFSPCFAQGPADGFFNIKNYGATGDGHTLDTKGFDKAIAACVKAGGGTVFVPPGTFVAGTIRLYSNMELKLSAGAVILASRNTNDYLLQTDFGFGGSGAGGKKLGIIFADRAENVSITGTGTIDGNAAAYMYMDSTQVSSGEDRKYSRQGKSYMAPVNGDKEAPVMWKGAFADRPGTELVFHACKKVTVQNITVRNANDWTFDLNACDNVKVLGITIDNDARVPNSDGIDMYDSKNVIIADCDVRVGDDGMAVISTSNLTVTNCNFSSRSCGIRIGYNGFNDNDSGNLLFDNVRIYGSNRGIGIFQRRGGNISNILFSNMIIDTRLFPGQWWGHGEPIHISALPGLGSKLVGTISNVKFTNIIAKGEEGIVLYGSAESILKDISFNNLQLTIAKGPFTNINGGNFDLRATNDSKLAIFKHDIPALFATHISGLVIKDMDVSWDTSLPPYFTNAIWCDNFQNLSLSGFTGSAAPNSSPGEAVIALRDGNGASLSGVKLTKGLKGVRHRLISPVNISDLSITNL